MAFTSLKSSLNLSCLFCVFFLEAGLFLSTNEIECRGGWFWNYWYIWLGEQKWLHSTYLRIQIGAQLLEQKWIKFWVTVPKCLFDKIFLLWLLSLIFTCSLNSSLLSAHAPPPRQRKGKKHLEKYFQQNQIRLDQIRI